MIAATSATVLLAVSSLCPRVPLYSQGTTTWLTNFSFTRWVEDSEDVGTAACRDLDAREDHEFRKLRVVSTQLF
jgi:hypothetical protein